MKSSSYIEWVNTQKLLKAAVRDWLTDNIAYANDLRITDIVFHNSHIWVETESKTRRKVSTKIKSEEVLKYMPDEDI